MRHFKLFISLVCLAFSSSALADFKVYSVDPNYIDEVYDVLRNVLPITQDGPTRVVQYLPTGQILVDTTPELHRQVVEVLDAIGEVEPTPRVRLQYWVLLGTPEAAEAGDVPDVLDDVVDELRQAHGPLSFRLLGNASLVTDSGMRGTTTGELSVNQTAYVQGARLHAQLSIGFSYQVVTGSYQAVEGQAQVQPFQTMQRRDHGVQLDTSMAQGEFVVVGENSITDIIDGEDAVDGTIFYIVHWPRAD